ncbi:MAG TPA: hypothetical protein VL574_01035 [Stellaceae bacterium]|nr:hypothetical protein [Stellaceae bacterium]
MKTQVTTNSADYPFSLSDDEFEYLSTQYFKGRIQVARSLYKPPSFYKLLASNISTILIGAVAASVAIAAAPEVTGASIFSLPALGVAGTRSAITAVSGAIGNALLPSVSVSDYIVGRKWPHYLAEWQRRQLA